MGDLNKTTVEQQLVEQNNEQHYRCDFKRKTTKKVCLNVRILYLCNLIRNQIMVACATHLLGAHHDPPSVRSTEHMHRW